MKLKSILLVAGMLGLVSCGQEGSVTDPAPSPSTRTVNGVELVLVNTAQGLALAGDEEVKRVGVRENQTLSTDDAKLYVFQNSMQTTSKSVTITMKAATDGTMSFTFGPSGLHFSPNAILEIKADKAALAGVDLSRLTAAGADDNVDNWQIIEGAYYDAPNNQVIVPISHFSRYALCIR